MSRENNNVSACASGDAQNPICQSLLALRDVIATLTAPDGCPWDKTQTPQSLADYIIEESHELVAAIRAGDSGEVCAELGDIMFLLLFVADLYEKQGAFNLADALNHNRQKMIRRHPHVFAGAEFASMDEQLKAWEAIKKKEKGHKKGLFSGLPGSLPPLVKAYRVHSKAARVGFTWKNDEDVERQVEAEWLEWLDAAHPESESEGAKEGDRLAAKKHELGDLLFSVVELGRRHGVKASEALDLATTRFLRRFASMEAMAEAQGRDLAAMSLDEQDELWVKAKEEEAKR